MDRLNKVICLVGIVGLCILFSCAHGPIKFIYLNDVLKHPSDSSQQKRDLIRFLYLKPDLVDTVIILYPKLLTDRQRESGYFLIDERDKFKIDLQKQYTSVEELIVNIDDRITRLLKQKFGISNPREDLGQKVLIYEGTAFVEFFGSHSVHALTFELKPKNQLIIGLAYVVVD